MRVQILAGPLSGASGRIEAVSDILLICLDEYGPGLWVKLPAVGVQALLAG